MLTKWGKVYRVFFLLHVLKLVHRLYQWRRRKQSLPRVKTKNICSPSHHPLFEKNYFQSRTNCQLWLYSRKWLTAQVTKPKGVIFVVCGLKEYIDSKDFIGRYFEARNYAVFGIDHLGHGRSEGDRFHIERFSDFSADFLFYINSILDQFHFRQLPRFLLGHSMGGLISVQLANIMKFDGVILTAPMFRAHPSVIGPGNLFLVEMVAKMFPKLRFPEDMKSICGKISRDQTVLSAFVRDPLTCAKTAPTLSLVVGMLQMAGKVLQNASLFSMPLLILHGSNDQITCPAASQIFYDNCSSENKSIKIYNDALHNLFTDSCKEDCLDDISLWLQKQEV